VAVEQFAVGRTLMDGYAIFFVAAGLVGIPALILCLFLARAVRPRGPQAEPTTAAA
jgi:PAT family beta-lactamase induction signal transducer AmpG